MLVRWLGMVHVYFEQWPLLLTVAFGKIDSADVETLSRAYEQAFRRGGRFASLVDLEGVTTLPTPVTRKAYADWRTAHAAELGRHVIAVAHVVGERPILRGAMIALSWVARHPAPEAYFAARSAARTWLEMHMARER